MTEYSGWKLSGEALAFQLRSQGFDARFILFVAYTSTRKKPIDAVGPQPVANAIKLFQACIYKSVNTGLF